MCEPARLPLFDWIYKTFVPSSYTASVRYVGVLVPSIRELTPCPPQIESAGSVPYKLLILSSSLGIVADAFAPAPINA